MEDGFRQFVRRRPLGLFASVSMLGRRRDASFFGERRVQRCIYRGASSRGLWEAAGWLIDAAFRVLAMSEIHMDGIIPWGSGELRIPRRRLLRAPAHCLLRCLTEAKQAACVNSLGVLLQHGASSSPFPWEEKSTP
ncbi:hypothetical protein cyc_05424 [Cyclospora cayetanensis]|uniref:Uncharacterized protein n=1 Tax=Cyclospora cayetanensis TaxID=88456 RepID=A0A1D3CZA0_9EIME|nr:hypothetical protein cyc_05424 [Cyclospora cayetanensis]